MTAAPKAEVPVARQSSKRRRGPGGLDTKLSPYLYISPFFLLFGLTGLFPLIFTIWVAFHNWDLIMGQGEFVGFENYANVLSGGEFWKSLVNTFSIFILSSVPQVLLAIVIAVLLDRNLRAATFWRMGVLLPYIVAPVAVALIFNNLFADRSGLVNSVLELVGIDGIAWHSDRFASHVAIATMVNFRWTGYNTLILLAAMQAVPRDLYDAATIDGAGPVRQFFSVTLPVLKPTLIFVIITSTIGGLQIFDEPVLYDQNGRGGADNQWQTLTLYLYDLGWGRADFGSASAVAVILFLTIVAIGLLNYLITQKFTKDGGKR